jgi:hypothetical protein
MECQLLQALIRLSPGLPLFHRFTKLEALFSSGSTLRNRLWRVSPAWHRAPGPIWDPRAKRSSSLFVVASLMSMIVHSFIEPEAVEVDFSLEDTSAPGQIWGPGAEQSSSPTVVPFHMSTILHSFLEPEASFPCRSTSPSLLLRMTSAPGQIWGPGEDPSSSPSAVPFLMARFSIHSLSLRPRFLAGRLRQGGC